MRENSYIRKAVGIAVVFVWLVGLVLVTASCSTGIELVGFLKNIDYYGGTKGEMTERLGVPNAVARSTTGYLATGYYYTGLEAVFDDYTGRISVLSVTDARWLADVSVSIGATKSEVAAALGDGYVTLSGDGARDVWVYFCPKPSYDKQAELCDYCRVCYISFVNGRVSKIEWSTELLGGY
jgi:hypothetical protein